MVEKQAQLQKFFVDVQTLSTTGNTFLKENEDRVIRLGEVSRPVLDLLEQVLARVAVLPQGDDGRPPRS